MQIEGSTLLVTGASGGIGQALCHRLQERGARLVLGGTHAAALRELAAQLDARHLQAAADMGTPEGREHLARICNQAGVDGVINLAGVLDFALFADQDPERIQRLLEVNTLGTILLTRALLPQLLKRPRARIVNVGSIFGSIGHPGFAVYCASKAAVKVFSEALARELADTTVSVAYIAPRATRTALNSERVNALNQALGNQTDSPEQVADAIVAILQSSATQRFIGWPERLFVKLNALLPALVQQALVKKLPLVKQYAAQPPKGKHP
ncbi:MAG: SDR family oxidoreductase [Burkholderiaceae bacterium]|jgi:short-subunit dehydrogenase|nr:SDR family oxidoreductase [Burkholderiaceae bacterium]